MSGVPFPMVSKWAFAYQRKGPCRYFDLVRVYADASFDHHPYATINLDFPLKLLKATGTRERPSHIAQACDLFSEGDLYRVLGLIEDHIVANGLFEPEDGILFVQSARENGDSPKAITAIRFSDALGLFGQVRFQGQQQEHHHQPQEPIHHDFQQQADRIS